MTSETFYEILGDINAERVNEAHTAKKDKKPAWGKWCALAACLCLVVTLSFVMEFPTGDGSLNPKDPAPHFVLGDRTFVVSSYWTFDDGLPKGFTYSGEIQIYGEGEYYSYYRNPDIPEWVYVYQETKYGWRYGRYVDERLRGAKLVAYNGQLYISMVSAKTYGDDPDVSTAFYDEMKMLYGKQGEGAAPDGFVSVGTTEFSGYDTIPRGELASNTDKSEVWANPDDPNVILVATAWHTSTAEEGKETRHEGYNTYILYGGSLE